MGPQVNWAKLKAELNKLADLEKLKAEVHRIGQEILKFDVHIHLSPTAKEKLKDFETKYQEISKTISKTQRQVDREFSRVMRNLKETRTKAEKNFSVVKTAAQRQKKQLEKASVQLRERVLKMAGQMKKTKKKTVRRKMPANKTHKAE